MMGIGLRRVLAVAISLLAFPAVAAAAGPLHFSAPRLIDTQTPPGSLHAIEAIDCPTGGCASPSTRRQRRHNEQAGCGSVARAADRPRQLAAWSLTATARFVVGTV
jgi:hypothetical protein